jgi:hypothetical protein
MKKLFFVLSLFATSLTYAAAPSQSSNSPDQSDIAYRGGGERGRGGAGYGEGERGGEGYGREGEGLGAPGRGVTPGVTPGRPGPER